MKTSIAVAALTLVTVLSGAASAAEDPAARLASEVCSKCHGPSGRSPSSLFPHLAGQQSAYLADELKQFRDHSRGDPHGQAYMWGIANPLNDRQIQGLADYFAKQAPAKGETADDHALAARGKDIYDNGVPDRNIPACSACHGDAAQGNENIPRLAGQHREYLIRELAEFRDGLRDNETMQENAKAMTDEDIRAMAEYLGSL